MKSPNFEVEVKLAYSWEIVDIARISCHVCCDFIGKHKKLNHVTLCEQQTDIETPQSSKCFGTKYENQRMPLILQKKAKQDSCENL